MGLSGRKVKQRIGKDPRNLSWADDASRFGQAYLEKFGWDASKGLGASGEGRTNAIKASQKLDMLGIGMRHQKDVDGGIAWRQNRDFEDLLRRLNEGPETTDTTGPLPLSFHKAHESESLEGEVEKATSEGGKVKDEDAGDDQEGVTTKKEKRKKKKKRKATEDEEVEEEQDLDRKERKKKKRKKSLSSKDDGDDEHAIPSDIASEPPPLPSRPLPHETRPADKSASTPIATATAIATDTATTMPAPVPIRAPPRTHRARFIAAKRMAASNSTALAEILGIPSSSSSSVYPSAVGSPVPGVRDPVPALATPTTTAAEAQDPLQKLTTSSQSVADYFRAKLGAKAHGERQACPTLSAVGGGAAPPLAPARDHDDDDDRAGLGLGRGAPRVPPPQDIFDEEPVRGGIGASSSSSSRFMTMFMPAQPTIEIREEVTATAGIEPVVSHDAADHDDNLRKIEKRRAKEERRREKEERRRKRAEAGQIDRASVDVPVHEVPAAGTQKKLRDPGAPDGWSADSPSSREAMDTKKRKKREKDKKSAKHRRHED